MKMRDQIITIFLFGFLASSYAANHHLICKSVNDVFSGDVGGHVEVGNKTIRSNIVQGKPGKRGPLGPRGLPGPRGLKGEAGYVDYNNITEIIERKICEGIAAITSGVDGLRRNVHNMQQTLEEIKCGLTGVLYNGTCYSTPHLSSASTLSYDGAKQACRKQGSKLAEIHDQSQQQMLEDFIRRKMPSSLNEIHVWLGMIRDRERNVLRYESGKAVALNHLVWWPNHPNSESFRHLMLLGVRRSGDDGVWSYKDHGSQGVICEKVI